MKRICKTSIILFVIVMCLSMCFALAGCGETQPEQLSSDYGITLEGGGFGKGSTLVTDVIEKTGEEGREIVALLENQEYDKDGEVSIFNIFVAKDGKEVQPNGKVKITIAAPFESENGYVTFHVKDDGSVEKLETTYAEGKISFETDSFSYFVVAEAEKYYTLSIINDSGTGKISLDGIEQEANKKAAINSGRVEGSESVLVATETSEDYAFIGWFGSTDTSNVWDIKYDNLLSTEKTFTFTMPAYDYVVYAVFRPVQDYYTLGIINVNGQGRVSLDGDEISGEEGISSGRTEGAESLLIATEISEDYVFVGWYGTMDMSNPWGLKYDTLL
ncbi:MAG: hypothetical protein ACI4S9_00075, partial [Christensenellales bacterium]